MFQPPFLRLSLFPLYSIQPPFPIQYPSDHGQILTKKQQSRVEVVHQSSTNPFTVLVPSPTTKQQSNNAKTEKDFSSSNQSFRRFLDEIKVRKRQFVSTVVRSLSNETNERPTTTMKKINTMNLFKSTSVVVRTTAALLVLLLCITCTTVSSAAAAEQKNGGIERNNVSTHVGSGSGPTYNKYVHKQLQQVAVIETKKTKNTKPNSSSKEAMAAAEIMSKLRAGDISNLFKDDDPSLRNGIINLIKNIVGISVLSLPSGIAAYGSTKDAVLPGLLLIGFVGIVSGYGFSLIGKVCCYTSSTSYKSAWSKTLGKETSWIPSLTIACQTFMNCLAIITILSNTFTTLFNIETKESLLGITLLALIPLCITSKDLQSLTVSSLVGVLGILFTAIAMIVRLVDGNYTMPQQVLTTILPDGSRSKIKVATVLTGYLADIPKFSRPSFGKRGMKHIFTTNSLILVSMLSTAFLVRLSFFCCFDLCFVCMSSLIRLKTLSLCQHWLLFLLLYNM